jgi:protein-disulfide isomerase
MNISNEVKVIIGIVIVCVLLLGAIIWFVPKTATAPVRDLSLLVRPESHMTGKFGAKVTLVEFGDYQCPACGTVAPYIKNIVDQYKNDSNFNFVHRDFPLSQHANAVPAAEAADVAGIQGKYWEMGELLYKNQKEWSDIANPTDLFIGYAKTLGLDTVKFKADIAQKKFVKSIQADLADAQALALDHTPFFFLNGVEVKDLASLKAQIDTALAK